MDLYTSLKLRCFWVPGHGLRNWVRCQHRLAAWLPSCPSRSFRGEWIACSLAHFCPRHSSWLAPSPNNSWETQFIGVPPIMRLRVSPMPTGRPPKLLSAEQIYRRYTAGKGLGRLFCGNALGFSCDRLVEASWVFFEIRDNSSSFVHI